MLSKCRHLQGNHCIKIGSKCLEKRWIGGVIDCLIKHERLPLRPDAPPSPPGKE